MASGSPLLGLFEQLVNPLLQGLLLLDKTNVREGLLPAGTGLELRSVQRHVSQFHQPGAPAQPQRVPEQPSNDPSSWRCSCRNVAIVS